MEATPERRSLEGPRLRVVVARRPDDGSVMHVGCRRCGELILLDPRRMRERKVGVFLLCALCDCRFLVRHTDLDRLTPYEREGPPEPAPGPVGVAPRTVVSDGRVRTVGTQGAPPPAVGQGPPRPATDRSPAPAGPPGSAWRRWRQRFSR